MSSRHPDRARRVEARHQGVRKRPTELASGGRVSSALLGHAGKVLEQVLQFQHPADAVLSRYFRNERKLGHRDRGFIAETVYAVLRRLNWLHALAGSGASARQLMLAWLARGQDWPLARFEGLVSSAELRWIGRVRDIQVGTTSLADELDLPRWLVDALLADHDEPTVRALAQGLNVPAPLDLRANLLKTSRDKLFGALREEGFAVSLSPYSPHGVRMEDKPALNRHPLFLDGYFEVQDEGSQLLGLLVAPRRRELVVDFCAGAGGKTLHLGALMRSTGRLYAFDVAEKRLARLRPRAARAGLSNIHPVVIAHENDTKIRRLSGKADRVLVDAPCSGLGTVRRNPDLKWRQSSSSVAEMVLRQQRILAAAARLVRPGGRLVYATCSVLRQENDAVVEAFLASSPAFRELDAGQILQEQGVVLPHAAPRLRMLPHVHGTDGFFAVVMERADG